MKFRDIGNWISAKAGIRPVAQAAATVNGVTITKGTSHSCVLHAHTGAETGGPTTRTLATKIQDSLDGSSWADLAGGAGVDVTAVNSESEANIDLSNARAFVRVVATVSFTGGASPTLLIAAEVVFGPPRKMPA